MVADGNLMTKLLGASLRESSGAFRNWVSFENRRHSPGEPHEIFEGRTHQLPTRTASWLWLVTVRFFMATPASRLISADWLPHDAQVSTLAELEAALCVAEKKSLEAQSHSNRDTNEHLLRA